MTKRVYVCLSFLFIFFIAKAQNNYNEVSLPELMKKKQSDKNMVIVDVRSNGEYYDSSSFGKSGNIGRIKDVIHIELRDLLEKPDAIKQLDAYKDRDVYLICSHSYRSRSASNHLLKNGFTHVNNVRGGMTEWFRRFDELSPYMNTLYETSTSYKNISSSQIASDLLAGKNPLLIGITAKPRFWWDSATVKFYEYFPLFKDAVYFDATDSAKVLQTAQNAKDRPVVLFNMVNNGAGELADWLTKNGVTNVSYLVGGVYYFYEYVRNKQLATKTARFMMQKNNLDFITAPNYCSMANKTNVQLIDLRHDTLFNKATSGIKYDFRYVKNSVNFPGDKGAGAFEQQFPDKKKEYILMSQNGITSLQLATELQKKGYKIYWLMGGLQRLEWYTINLEDFACKDFLIQ
jgi:rhodanese-related sulfurtransferase